MEYWWSATEHRVGVKGNRHRHNEGGAAVITSALESCRLARSSSSLTGRGKERRRAHDLHMGSAASEGLSVLLMVSTF